MKIISFGLWGTDPRYLVGAIKNAEIQPVIYPGWTCRYYIDNLIPVDTVKKLESMGCQIINKGPADGWIGLYWRFEPMFDSTIERFIVRDCDSRLNVRESAAVDEWELSNFPFHAMRDHGQHCVPILGAMWGAIPLFVDNIKELYDGFMKNVNPFVRSRGKYFYTDQLFLGNIIWPLIKNKCLVHDDARRMTGAEKPFPIKLPSGFFVGQRFDENNNPIFE